MIPERFNTIKSSASAVFSVLMYIYLTKRSLKEEDGKSTYLFWPKFNLQLKLKSPKPLSKQNCHLKLLPTVKTFL